MTALAACSPAGAPETAGVLAPTAQEPLAPVPIDPMAGPSGLDRLSWMYDDGVANGSGRPRLMYSARASDEMGLNLQCVAPGSVEALIVHNAPDVMPQTHRFTLHSGGASKVLSGAATGEAASEMFVRAPILASDPVLTALRDTGRVSLTDDGQTHVFDAVDETEREAIRQFFAVCA